MNDQDRDLIAALAEGRLSTDAAADATARIESDPELASEYADQVAALDFLGSSAVPHMTPSERTTLHANLVEQLGLAQAPAAAPAKNPVRWWVPVFGLATAAAVVAAVVIFPGSTDNTFQEAGASLDTTNATQSDSSPTTGASAEESVTEDHSSSADGGISVYETNAVDLSELLTEAGGADSPDEVQQQLSALRFKSTIDLDPDQVDLCLDKLDAELPAGIEEILVIGADPEDGETVVHLGFDYGEGVEDGLSFVLGTCSLVEHSPQG